MSRHPGPRIALAVVAAAGAAVAVVTRRSFPTRVEGPSMLPTLRPGDFIAVSPGSQRLRRGNIVVVRLQDGLEIIKRAVALPGDRYHGNLVPPGHVFLAGDNPSASTDSRVTGPVPVANLVGIARAVYWPLRRAHVL